MIFDPDNREVVASHVRPALTPQSVQRIVEKMLHSIDQVPVAYDAIAVRGVSGLLIGPILAFLRQKNLIVVRKKHRSDHSTFQVEGAPVTGSFRYLIVDDLVCSGATVEFIYRKLKSLKCECVGVCLYRDSTYVNSGVQFYDGVRVPGYGFITV